MALHGTHCQRAGQAEGLAYQRCRGAGAQLKGRVTQVHTAAGKVQMPETLWLGPIQDFSKHGSIVWDMDMVNGLGAWQCGGLYPPQRQVSDGRLD